MYKFDDVKMHWFEVWENDGKSTRYYLEYTTDFKMRNYLNQRHELYGYVPGLGGNKRYSIVAAYLQV